MSGYLEYCRMKGAEVIFWTAWNGPDPTRGLLIPEVIRFIRDGGTKPDDFRYDLDDLLRSNEVKPSA